MRALPVGNFPKRTCQGLGLAPGQIAHQAIHCGRKDNKTVYQSASFYRFGIQGNGSHPCHCIHTPFCNNTMVEDNCAAAS